PRRVKLIVLKVPPLRVRAEPAELRSSVVTLTLTAAPALTVRVPVPPLEPRNPPMARLVVVQVELASESVTELILPALPAIRATSVASCAPDEMVTVALPRLPMVNPLIVWVKEVVLPARERLPELPALLAKVTRLFTVAAPPAVRVMAPAP